VIASIDGYAFIKTVHIVTATILFGTGLGTAFFFWSSRRADDSARLFAASTTVRADVLFTLPAVILQPLTGAWMAWRAGFDLRDPWLALSIALYLLAGLCWLPVVGLQIRMKKMLEAKVRGGEFDHGAFVRLQRLWFILGWPAFGGLLVVFFLMVAKPG